VDVYPRGRLVEEGQVGERRSRKRGDRKGKGK
jgi:hypothetical protein